MINQSTVVHVHVHMYMILYVAYILPPSLPPGPPVRQPVSQPQPGAPTEVHRVPQTIQHCLHRRAGVSSPSSSTS